jgi:hypothetical protein
MSKLQSDLWIPGLRHEYIVVVFILRQRALDERVQTRLEGTPEATQVNNVLTPMKATEETWNRCQPIPWRAHDQGIPQGRSLTGNTPEQLGTDPQIPSLWHRNRIHEQMYHERSILEGICVRFDALKAVRKAVADSSVCSRMAPQARGKARNSQPASENGI